MSKRPVGDEVLVQLPVQDQPLAAKYHGPNTVERCVGQTDYVVKTSERRNPHQLCHVDILKPYHRPSDSSATPLHVSAVVVAEDDSVQV